uniref:Uncharacterized protein n=1 Tax=Maricaulis virginensis TaxID=144022 RepID=A0A9W6MMG3_9PROT|nr:hypothetical protein [Maricaulis virginensis]GLK50968.1 hypothetical protein GCM10017621_04760 [Maricaulis virginensis]
MGGLIRFLGDILKPLLTLLVTVLGLAFAVSVFSPAVDNAIETHLPAWTRLDPAQDCVRAWLGLEEEDAPAWWQFWRD